MEKIRIRTYNKIFKTQFKMYKIDNIKLPIAITVWDLILFVFGFFISLLLHKVVGDFDYFGKAFIKYIALPVGIRTILTKFTHDGKKAHKYFFDMIVFFVKAKTYERFKVVKVDKFVGFKKVFYKKYKRKDGI